MAPPEGVGSASQDQAARWRRPHAMNRSGLAWSACAESCPRAQGGGAQHNRHSPAATIAPPKWNERPGHGGIGHDRPVDRDDHARGHERAASDRMARYSTS